jgi:hypothetical protein
MAEIITTRDAWLLQITVNGQSLRDLSLMLLQLELAFWVSGLVWYSERTSCPENWVCYHPQV